MAFKPLTVEQGLSQNSVVSISQDSTGYMWFATQDGLNKYDGKTFEFYNKHFEDVTRPTFSKLGKTYIDRTGELWIIEGSGVLEKFNSNTQTFQSIQKIQNPSCIFQDSKMDYYIGTYGEGLFRIQHKTKDTIQLFKDEFEDQNIFEFLEDDSKLYIATSAAVYQLENTQISTIETENFAANFSALEISEEKTIWLGTFGLGLYLKPQGEERFIEFNHPKLPKNLNIQDLLIDKTDRLWIATYGDGVYLYDATKQTIQHFIVDKSDPFGLHYDDVLCLFEDYSGTIWLGTDGGGLSYYDEHLTKFNVITNEQTPSGISVDLVRAITVDNKETVWIGTSGKGLTAVNLEQQRYKTYTTQNSKLSSDRIMSLLFYANEVWIGHQGEGLQIMETTGKIKSFPETSKMTIWKIYKDSSSNIWLCTRDNGLVLFDKNRGIIKRIHAENSALTTNNIRTIEEGNTNDIWIGSEDQGLFLVKGASQNVEKISEIPNKIKSLYFEGQTLWIGTNGSGLKKYNTSNKKVDTYTIAKGLSNNVIYGILPDSQNNIWLSSNKGLMKFNVVDSNKKNIDLYAANSGLQALEFNTGAYFINHTNQLYFGGLKGVNWFNPKKLTLNPTKPKTVISKFEIFGKEQQMSQNVILKNNQNTVTFTFAALHFSQPEENLYKYQLINHDTDWTFPGKANVAHYTNLPPNNYTFRVVSSNYDGIWNEEPVTYSFRILKPWYLTNVMKIGYVFFVFLVLYSIYLYLKFRWDVKIKLQLKHSETERLKKLNDFKTTLYTNISHEFRTPLTLISGPIDHQLAKKDLTETDRKELDLVKQNATRLLNLVNQMMDLSLIDAGQLKLQVEEGDLNILLKQIVAAFTYKATLKELTIVAKMSSKQLDQAWFDKDIMEKVTSNLLSNAIKYAPENSKIIFDVTKKDGFLILSLVNVHSSLKVKDLSRLFQRFYQDDENLEGVGVGLALVKELVTLSKGSIIVNTVDEKKIQFTVTLPIEKSAFTASEMVPHLVEDSIQETEVVEINESSEKMVLLIVEDDPDIRKFVVSIFSDTYAVLEAENGEIGIKKAVKYLPELIISDIMMPVQDGIALCNTLKYNELTSHIPIILLTAKVGEENEMTGLKTGADAYVTKPFNSENLKLRVEKLIESRIQLQIRYSKDFTIGPELAVTSTESSFLNRLKTVLDKEITRPDFKSEDFAKEMLLSRTQLHRKLKAIFNMPASEFIRSQRLKLSLELLKESDATISEIAYQVGFNTPSYFIKCFRETYNCTPTEYYKE
ncbi:hybrid sensor histidine kinase/response regulator transcription factor [Rasiella sp. SM2506]|uniref:hybrid sensor histidine kinase/response regulator transcription factor n=1 Tax=Rasiella sp. SM2506 TaxID=3423914 RepID=UPI003D7BC4DA